MQSKDCKLLSLARKDFSFIPSFYHEKYIFAGSKLFVEIQHIDLGNFVLDRKYISCVIVSFFIDQISNGIFLVSFSEKIFRKYRGCVDRFFIRGCQVHIIRYHEPLTRLVFAITCSVGEKDIVGDVTPLSLHEMYSTLLG